MAKIGSFGTPKAAEDDTFEWFGEECRVHPEFGLMVLTDLMEEFGAVVESENLTAMALILRQMFGSVVHPDDFERFWATGKKNRAMPDDFMDLMQGLVEGMTGRPTERPSESSDGPEPSVDGSKVAYLRQVSAGRPEIEAGLIETALERGELRPAQTA